MVPLASRQGSVGSIIVSGVCREHLVLWGQARLLGRLAGLRTEREIPAAERVFSAFIEDTRPNLQKQMRAARSPLHLLRLDPPLAQPSAIDSKRPVRMDAALRMGILMHEAHRSTRSFLF